VTSFCNIANFINNSLREINKQCTKKSKVQNKEVGDDKFA